MQSEIKMQGNLGRTPTLKFMENSTAVCNFSIYCNRKVKKNDTYIEKGGFWMECSLFGKRAEDFARVAKKGMATIVSGELFEDSWNDENGEERKKLKCLARGVSFPPYQLENVTLKNNQEQTSDSKEQVSKNKTDGTADNTNISKPSANGTNKIPAEYDNWSQQDVADNVSHIEDDIPW